MAIQPVQDIVKFIATTIHFRSKYLKLGKELNLATRRPNTVASW